MIIPIKQAFQDFILEVSNAIIKKEKLDCNNVIFLKRRMKQYKNHKHQTLGRLRIRKKIIEYSPTIFIQWMNMVEVVRRKKYKGKSYSEGDYKKEVNECWRIILHEVAHLKYPHHKKTFWEYNKKLKKKYDIHKEPFFEELESYRDQYNQNETTKPRDKS